MTTNTTTISAAERDQIAQETAEHIAATLTPPSGYVQVIYADGRRPPRAVPEIKKTLLDGHVWISWMDDRVIAAMRALHGELAGNAAFLIPEDSVLCDWCVTDARQCELDGCQCECHTTRRAASGLAAADRRV